MYRYPLHKLSTFDLATAKQLQKQISLWALLEWGRDGLLVWLGKKMHLRKELNENQPPLALACHTHRCYCANRNRGSKAAVKSNFVKWKYITSREVLLKRRKAGSTPRPWAQKILKPQLTCFTLTGKKATLQITQLLPTVKISSMLKTVALQSAYCPLAFIWQDLIRTGRSIWKKRWRRHRPLTDPYFNDSMQLFSCQNCGFFFLSKPHTIS